MRRLLPAFALLVAIGSCGGPRHYAPGEIVDIPPDDRDILFGHVRPTTVVIQETVREYAHKVIRCRGRVLDVADLGSPSWPLRVKIEVPRAEGGRPGNCDACFGRHARDYVSGLRKGDQVTVVGRVSSLLSYPLDLHACELIRATRGRKQIYPPPEEQTGAEDEKKP